MKPHHLVLTVLLIGFAGMSLGDEPALDEVSELKERIRQLEKEKQNAHRAFWHTYAVGVLDQAWVAVNIHSGTQKRLEESIQRDLPQYVQTIITSPIRDEQVVVSALWMVKAYYEKSQVHIPEEIQAILAALPPRPPASCESRLKQLENAEPPRSDVLGSVGLAFDGYTQDGGVGWHAVILATNTSSMTIECVALSYTAGFPLGSTVIATNVDVEMLAKRVEWTRREPETPLARIDLRMLERVGIGRVLDLRPGEHARLLLPLCVPQPRAGNYVQHLVFAYRPSASAGAQVAYETHVAELRRE